MIRYFLFLLPLGVFAQTSTYTFTVVRDNKATPVEDQCMTGTCWSYATISFLESEIQRKGGQAVDLSEMFNVRMTYPRKAASYVRYQGKTQLSQGGLSHDVFETVRQAGLVPESAYTGNATYHDHTALDVLIGAVTEAALEKKLYEKNNDWLSAVEGMLDGMLGAPPAFFQYNGQKYTPLTFRDAMGIKPEEYVGLTSFTHKPWYSPMVVEVPDNWSHGTYYNLPMNELMETVDAALNAGFTISWDGDVSEPGFSHSSGVAIQSTDTVSTTINLRGAQTELATDQNRRQRWYEQLKTTDDHLMHITGTAKDQKGNIFYITKNSWGDKNPYKGFLYMSKPYFYYKTICIYVHRDALNPILKKKLGL
jgi:bleomycin hydrolase